jgi:hypothetical protein
MFGGCFLAKEIQQAMTGLTADARRNVVWADLWDEFFNEIQPEFLVNDGVKHFWTLRESAVPAFGKHDGDRSNFAVRRRNGLPRMDEPTIKRLTGLMAAATGVSRSADDVSFEPMPDCSRSFPMPIHVRSWETRGTFSTFVRFQS